MDNNYDQAKAYIRQQLNMGLSPDDIANQLRGAGWSEEHIHAVFKSHQADMMPSTPAPATPPPDPMGASAQAGNAPQMGTSMPQASTVRGGRISTGWKLFKQGLNILKGNRYLIRYTVMAMLWSLLIALIYFIVIIVVVLVNRSHGGSVQSLNGILYCFLFIYYVVLFFITNYYAAGLTANVLDIFQGQQKGYHNYMDVARSKTGALLLYAVIEATVGFILRFVVERIRWVGWILSRILGVLWSLGTMFTVPIIVTSPHPNAPKAIGQSVKLFKNTWGESIVAKITINLPIALITFAYTMVYFIVVMFIGILAGNMFGGAGAAVVWFVALFIWIISIIAISIFSSLINNIINVALFYYATYHQIPPAFDANLLNSVFVQRRRGLFGRGKS